MLKNTYKYFKIFAKDYDTKSLNKKLEPKCLRQKLALKYLQLKKAFFTSLNKLSNFSSYQFKLLNFVWKVMTSSFLYFALKYLFNNLPCQPPTPLSHTPHQKKAQISKNGCQCGFCKKRSLDLTYGPSNNKWPRFNPMKTLPRTYPSY